ncbi:TlpA family protein disulfide reductase [Halobaculum sp. MBLA0147]|uniref:TlpA family protein disulfide reductase n=1 Tax=Halobaculum sp. MBLA0147 TaxID=3079934 RepID=UPI0035268FB5
MPSTDRRTVLTAAVLAVSGTLAGCSGVTSGGSTEATGGGAESGSESTGATGTESGRIALESVVTAGDLPSGTVPLRREGTVSLVNFFATWCGPCKEEMPAFRKLRAKYDPSQLHMVSVTPQVDEAAIEAFWEEYDATWPVVSDASLAATQRWDADSYPTNLLFERDGEPASDTVTSGWRSGVNARSFEELDELIAPLVEEGRS